MAALVSIPCPSCSTPLAVEVNVTGCSGAGCTDHKAESGAVALHVQLDSTALDGVIARHIANIRGAAAEALAPAR